VAIPLGPGNVLGELRWDLDGLNAKLDAYAKALHLNLADAVKQTAFKLELAIKARTPVDTGRARNSWHTVVWGGSPTHSYRDNRGHSFSETLDTSPTRDTQAVVGSAVTYMLMLEAGWSRKAPQGFVRLAVKEMRTQFIAAVIAAEAKAAKG
jgi:hypothetical protein